MNLVYKLSEDEFINLCAKKIQEPNKTIFEAIYESIAYFLSFPKDTNLSLIDIKHHYKCEYYDSNLSLVEYIENGFIEFYYPEFDLYSKKDHPILIDEVFLPNFIDLLDVNYGNGIIKNVKIKNHKLKTKNKVTIQLLHIKIFEQTLNKILSLVNHYDNHILASNLGAWEWKQTFYNKITGECSFCSCFEKAIQKDNPSITDNQHPHLKKALKNNSFKENLCHICLRTNSNLSYCNAMYSSSFKVKYGVYIKKTSIEYAINEREAENIVREMKGVAKIGEKWINETLLFNYIALLFPNNKVQREASPSWLGMQRLDIFIPELNVAIEYQGQQHFKAVKLFGGEEGLKKAKERDTEKYTKCKQNNINLIYFTYKDDLSEKLVHSRLKNYL